MSRAGPPPKTTQNTTISQSNATHDVIIHFMQCGLDAEKRPCFTKMACQGVDLVHIYIFLNLSVLLENTFPNLVPHLSLSSALQVLPPLMRIWIIRIPGWFNVLWKSHVCLFNPKFPQLDVSRGIAFFELSGRYLYCVLCSAQSLKMVCNSGLNLRIRMELHFVRPWPHHPCPLSGTTPQLTEIPPALTNSRETARRFCKI